MNREIKFRAWDRELKVMRYRWLNIIPDSKHAFAYGKHDEDLDGANDNVQRYFTDTLMQYTGLKDKNGKEIYEGDLLQHIPDGTEPRAVIEVIWDRDSAAFLMKEGKGLEAGYHFMAWMNYYTTIGNIYENPELIKTV